MTPSIADLIDELSAFEAAASAAPWFYRPDKYDDWGFIRGGEPTEYGLPVVAISRTSEHDCDHDEHRINKTDPYEPNGRLIVALRNNAKPILDAIKSLQAERDAMPTIWEDPAGKGYPCFERPMTAAECKQALTAAQETIGRLREALGQVKMLLPESGVRHIPMTPTEDQRNVGRSSDLHQHGDMRLVWANEGDLIHTSLASDIARKSLETEGAER